jgi:hypothetical protein
VSTEEDHTSVMIVNDSVEFGTRNHHAVTVTGIKPATNLFCIHIYLHFSKCLTLKFRVLCSLKPLVTVYQSHLYNIPEHFNPLKTKIKYSPEGPNPGHL